MRAINLTPTMIEGIAAQVSRRPLGLALHKPESWALPTNCFRNVVRKVRESGGRAQFGWTFHHRFAEKIPGHPLYLYLTHHAVWADPDGRLIDVTPYPDARHRPITTGNDPLFLVDDTARPIAVGGQPAPLPSRFFAVDDGPELAAYVAELNRKERKACEELYASAGTSATSR